MIDGSPPPVSPLITPELLVWCLGLLVSVVGSFRIPLLLSQEFPDDDPVIQDPIAFAVPSSIAFKRFKAENWQAFRAMFAALQFQRFFCRFQVFLKPQFGTVVFLILLGLAFVSFVIIRLQKIGPTAETALVLGFGLLVAAWVLLIERGKALKRGTTYLRVI